ncbi:MAG: efflux RND transporter periplasmic adaptor subunit [Polyangiaceae bacterium]|nr:efflux RND transporter periplasmic adaptor subunit [Polyangiaceae bacterium]
MRLVYFFALFVSLIACHKAEGTSADDASAKQSAPVKVEIVAVAERPMPEYLTLTGTLRASQESEVAADASGKVTATYVERGQRVKQGDTLALLDARSATLTARAANAQTELARAQLDQAKKECDRVQALYKSGAISQAEYDRTTSQCATTQWSAAAAQAQQQSAQKIVADAVIRAPFSGVVGERLVNVGQYVQSSTKIVSLYDPDPLRLELTVPEANVGAIKADMPVTFTVASFGEDHPFSGAVKFISPNVRPATRDLVVEALCPNGDGKLRPGMFAVANLAVGERNVPVVPSSTLLKADTGPRVFVVLDKRIQERIVQLGGEKDGFVGIVAGVNAGENVVDKPGPEVRDGAQAL